ncbi:hypothetical protein BH23GEM4_BH23GEM4_25160 [soil metagenome]
MNRFATITGVSAAATVCLVLAGCAAEPDDENVMVEDAAVVEVPAETTAAQAAAPMVAEGALLDPDIATRDELLTVTGIDAATADALVAGRPYADMLAVDRILAANLNEAQREAVYARLWKPIDLNTASEAEILLIPGVGNRMRHEFEEYRPYRAIEQFRREIGKYVDDEEVARLERYVVVR